MALYATLLVALLSQDVLCRVFERCELVRELSKKKHRIPPGDLATWVCIARHESEFNTSAVGHLNADRSGDHGLFQISDLYWCSPPGAGEACGLACDQLEDDDITDDIICARRIFRAHKRRTGDGFTAWAVYGPHCRGDNSAFVEGCEEHDTSTTEKPATPTAVTTGKPNTRPKNKKPITTTTTTPTPSLDITIDASSTMATLEDWTTSSDVSPTSDRSGKLEFFPIILSHQSYSNIDLQTREPVSVPRARLPLSRFSETSSPWNQRPTLATSREDPKTTWFNIHYHPKFLDELP